VKLWINCSELFFWKDDFRVCADPKRLWKRYATNNPAFVRAILPQMMGLRDYPLEK
jgi:hypothetical protein